MSNLIDNSHIPSREHIRLTLERIKEVLFPGFYGTETTDEKNIKDYTLRRLKDLKSYLTVDLNKTLSLPEYELKESSLETAADQIIDSFFEILPNIRDLLYEDAQAIFEGDPAAKSINEVIISYPGFQAIVTHRIAHFFYLKQVPLIPRMMAELVHSTTGIDIHPGAQIGKGFCIDHGTGIVIGETSIIGNYVKLYQGVTLGAFSVKKESSHGKRHPTLNNYVTVYAGSTILGGDTVIGEHSVVGGNVWLVESLPPSSKVYLAPNDKLIKRTP